MSTYEHTRARLEDYFDRTASSTWARLTSDAPVSRIRQTVREGRDAMRATLLDALPNDLSGTRILDAGCGPGSASIALAERGAQVLAVDISPSLLEVAALRTPDHLKDRITYHPGDMINPDLGGFDHVLAMDSLIHYSTADIAAALSGLAARTRGSIIFTVAPKTALLTVMWRAGQVFPKSDRSPAIQPQSTPALAGALRDIGMRRPLKEHARISRGFYISQALEVAP
ncbi:MAG: magnesium protoporphyrin IX methyltransferase [Pseudomonadota bacterium]